MYKHAFALSLALAITACSSPSGNDDQDPVGNKEVSPPGEETSGGDQVIEDSELVMPKQLSLVAAKSNTSSSASSISAFAVAEEGGFLAAGTDYSNTKQNTYVWLEALEPLQTVDGILCFIDQLKPEQEVNEGPYLVLADLDTCFDKEESGNDEGQNSGSSGSEGAINYTEVIVESTRDEADNAPLEMQAWFIMQEDDFSQAIRLFGTVSEGASEDNPYGAFRLTYQFAETLDALDAASMGKGELATVDTLIGYQGFTLYEEILRGAGDQFITSASVVVNPEEESGVALTGYQRSGDLAFEGNKSFALAYNNDHLLIQSSGAFDTLPYKNDDQTGTCLSRNSFVESVWRYGLYDINDGAEVEVNSGFPFIYDSNQDGSLDQRGYASYWGVWTEDETANLSGVNAQRETFDGSTGEEYQIIQASGRLVKKTVVSLELSELSGVQFEYYEWDEETGNGEQYLLEYDNSEEAFVKVASIQYGDEGREITDLETPLAIDLEEGYNLYMYSEQLGGGVQYLDGSSAITFFNQAFINGSETAAGELFENGTATLYCYQNCPLTGLGSADLANYDSPFTSSDELSAPIEYSISNTGDNALELMLNGEVVSFPEGVDEDSDLYYKWGFFSGGMTTDTSGMSSVYDIYDVEIIDVYYEFETGPSSWNKQTSLLDTSGKIISFDQPLNFTYRHSDENDRSTSAGRFDDQMVLMNYGGYGDLWGIPGKMDEEQGYYVPAFSLADAVMLGRDNQYVVKALDIEQRMQPADGQCTSLAISDPAAPIPVGLEGELNNDPVPNVTDAPRYIAGVAAEELSTSD